MRSGSRWSSAVRTRSREVVTRRRARGVPGHRVARLLDVEQDVERVPVSRVAALRGLDPAALAVHDHAPLDEQRVPLGRARAGARPRGSRARRRSWRCLAGGGSRRAPGHRGASPSRGPRAITAGAVACTRIAISTAIGSSSAQAQPPQRDDRLARPRGRAPPPRRRSTAGSRAPAPSSSGGGRGAPSRARTSAAGPHGDASAARATKLPLPGIRSTRPSSARRCIALRAVIRLTPNSAHRSASDGRASPGLSVAIRSRSACSIRRHCGTYRARLIPGLRLGRGPDGGRSAPCTAAPIAPAHVPSSAATTVTGSSDVVRTRRRSSARIGSNRRSPAAATRRRR